MISHKQRLIRQALFQDVDSIPSIGGWMLNVDTLAQFAGITRADYLADPFAGFLGANRALRVDGIISGHVVPDKPDVVRTGSHTEADYSGHSAEEVLADAERIPDDPAELLRGFNAEAVREEFRGIFARQRAAFGGIEPVPNFWEFGGPFPLYWKYGYIAFFEACALYPEAVGKIWWSKCVVAAARAKAFAPLFKELDLVPVMLCGEDLCVNTGPMVSPEMIRRHYFPHVKMITEPFVDAGVRLIHHCDGDINPFPQDFLDIGFSGFQGFQYECGIDVWQLRKLKPALGEVPLIFGGLSVARTLPWGTPDDVRREVDYLVDATDGGRGLFLFTSNVTGHEVPAANIAAGYARVKERAFGVRGTPPVAAWPVVEP